MNPPQSNPPESQSAAGAPPRFEVHALLPGALVQVALWLFVAQCVTGFALMTVYSPSTATAWGSVWHAQTRMPAGGFVRGLHHVASDVFLVVAAWLLFLLLWRGLFRKPLHWVWWSTLALTAVALALSLTGRLLPWDQKGYWGTVVRANILAKAPILGNDLRRILLGGDAMSNLTLTRFHALHVILLPVFVLLLLIATRRVFRQHSWAEESNSDVDMTHERVPAWVHSILPGLAVAVVIFVSWVRVSLCGDRLLDAPADPSAADFPARPEWHTLFLFQWLKAFEGPTAEVVGAIVIPGVITMALFSLPLLNRLSSDRLTRIIARAFGSLLFAGILILSMAAVLEDRDPGDDVVAATRQKQSSGAPISDAETRQLRASDFQRQKTLARRRADRAMDLAAEKGIPPEGPASLLSSDPLTRGPMLFSEHCAICHRVNGHDGLGAIPADPPTSSDLAGFASREWIRGLLSDPKVPRYFGRMKSPDGEPAHTKMAAWTNDMRSSAATDADRAALEADFAAVAAYLEDESRFPGRLRSVAASSALVPDPILRGRQVFLTLCNECHSYDSQRFGSTHAPDFFGYGSPQWIEKMIAEPDHELRYRATGREPARMPRFKERLTEKERFLVARWLSSQLSDISETIENRESKNKP